MTHDLPGPTPGLRLGRDVPDVHEVGRWVDPIELLIGLSLGRVDSVRPLKPNLLRTPRQSLEDVIRPALRRPPCLVTFSGGRDSSTILAIATDLARREGHELPIAVTHRFPGIEVTDESDWQEVVINHLRLPDWQRLEWCDELDAIGPYARRSLLTTGLGAPFNQHFLLPMIDLACGGSLLTGIGGDELFIFPLRGIANRVRYRWAQARPRDLVGFVAQSAPAAVRTAHFMRQDRMHLPWIRPSAADRLHRRLASSSVRSPVRYDDALSDAWWRDRVNQVSREQVRRLGNAGDVAVQHPFTAAPFLTSFAAAGGAAGPPGRARTLRTLLAGLLPDVVVSRGTKASFGPAFAAGPTQQFAQSWTGSGVDHDHVDADALRAEWRTRSPDARTMLLLQAAWSADQAQHRRHRVVDPGEVSRPHESVRRDAEERQ